MYQGAVRVVVRVVVRPALATLCDTLPNTMDVCYVLACCAVQTVDIGAVRARRAARHNLVFPELARLTGPPVGAGRASVTHTLCVRSHACRAVGCQWAVDTRGARHSGQDRRIFAGYAINTPDARGVPLACRTLRARTTIWASGAREAYAALLACAATIHGL